MKLLLIAFVFISFLRSEEYTPYPFYPLEMNGEQEKKFHDGFVQLHTDIQDLSPLKLDNPKLVNVKETIPWKTKTLFSVEHGYLWEAIPYKFKGALRYIFVIRHEKSNTLGIYEMGTDGSFFIIATLDKGNKESNNLRHYILGNKKYYFDNKQTNEAFIYTLNSKKTIKPTQRIPDHKFTSDLGDGPVLSHDQTMTLTNEWKIPKHLLASAGSYESKNIFVHGLKLTYTNSKEKILFSYRIQNGYEGWHIGRKQFTADDSKIYFDNSGGFACIWKYSLERETLEKIVPEHETELIKVFTYKDKDYILYLQTMQDKIVFKLATQ